MHVSHCSSFCRPRVSAGSWRWFAAAAAVVTLLAGCGGGGGSSGGAPADTPSAAPAEADVAGTVQVAGVSRSNARVVLVGSAPASAYPGATRYAQLTSVPWASLAAGTAVHVAAGTYAGPVTVTATGTASAPITVDALDNANPPVVTDSVDIQQSAYLQIGHLVVQAPNYAGFIVRRASHDIVVADSRVSKAPMGINVTDSAGLRVSLLRNRIEDSATDGIGVDGINGDASNRSVIEANTVVRSGQHGIEIRGSNWRIERNDVSASGQAMGGTSGIHLYVATLGDGTGTGNLIRYNLSHDNVDTSAYDGNGLQADRWCDGNTFAFNVAWNNDGAGVAIYDANNNQIYANTLRGNGRDPGNTHQTRGEVVVNSSWDSIVNSTARPSGNRVYDNALVATLARVPALYVDTHAVWVGTNVAAPNLLVNTGGGTVLRWTDSNFLATVTDIDAATGNTANLVKAPAFADVANPQTDGLRLTAVPGPGSVALTGQVDRLGKTGVAGATYFGAYFIGP